jgi:hypothetical protein
MLKAKLKEAELITASASLQQVMLNVCIVDLHIVIAGYPSEGEQPEHRPWEVHGVQDKISPQPEVVPLLSPMVLVVTMVILSFMAINAAIAEYTLSQPGSYNKYSCQDISLWYRTMLSSPFCP